ncbi:aminotransferase class III [Verrucomicrobia bacterium SCGC AG-212-E04]|nr:aminotransferase class III [Verrucomicrobia bacterium SCGC AG-212-E04]
MNRPDYSKSAALFARATQVIPGGIYGHSSPALVLPGASPYYAARAEGGRYWDVDGNEFLDFMCAYGPIVLGYNHPEVEEAAARQARDGNCFNHPTALMVELAERLVSLVDLADWAVFGKNGADMTTWCTQVAREHTGRKKILRVTGAYHGAHAWCSPGHGGWIDEDRAHIHAFSWNDLDAFRDLVKQHRGEIACVITTAYHHPAFGDSVMPAPGFMRGIQETCRAENIVFILDDVRSGFRLHFGGSHRYFEFEPDMICFCKALANGHPISAALGRAELQAAAGRVFLTGSYWNSAVPMAAALSTLKVIERDGVIERIGKAGAELRAGFLKAAAKHGLPIRYTGHDSMPFMTFADETNFLRSQRFCREMMQRGVFLHPHHNWFLCAAHEPRDIAQALAAANEAMAAVKAGN